MDESGFLSRKPFSQAVAANSAIPVSNPQIPILFVFLFIGNGLKSKIQSEGNISNGRIGGVTDVRISADRICLPQDANGIDHTKSHVRSQFILNEYIL